MTYALSSGSALILLLLWLFFSEHTEYPLQIHPTTPPPPTTGLARDEINSTSRKRAPLYLSHYRTLELRGGARSNWPAGLEGVARELALNLKFNFTLTGIARLPHSVKVTACRVHIDSARQLSTRQTNTLETTETETTITLPIRHFCKALLGPHCLIAMELKCKRISLVFWSSKILFVQFFV